MSANKPNELGVAQPEQSARHPHSRVRDRITCNPAVGRSTATRLVSCAAEHTTPLNNEVSIEHECNGYLCARLCEDYGTDRV